MAFNAFLPPATPTQIAKVHSLIHVTSSMLRYDREEIVASLAFPLVELILLGVLLQSGLAGQIGNALGRRTKLPLFISGLIFWIGLHAATEVALLPLTYYSGFVLPHRFGLSTQALQPWIGDVAKGWAVDMAVGAPIAAGLLVLIRKSPKRWPIVAAAVMIPVTAIGIFAAPLLIDPMFNKVTPMAQTDPLYSRIEILAGRAGISGAQIFIVDKSKQTNETNAYVTGLGSSTRIVIWDTLIRRMPANEVAAVVGHEMGHYAEHHVMYGFIGSVAVLFLVLPLMRKLAEELIKWKSQQWQIHSLDEPAALVPILLVFNVMALAATPVAAAASRYIEHRADAFGIAVTGDRVTFAKSMVGLSSDNLADPYPPAWVALLMDHPPLGERIDFALTGQPRDLWPKPGLPDPSGHTLRLPQVVGERSFDTLVGDERSELGE